MKSIIYLAVFAIVSKHIQSGLIARHHGGRLTFNYNAIFGECEGKDRGNYTLMGHFTRDHSCDITSDITERTDLLITTDGFGQKTVSKLQVVADSVYPSGAHQQFETLFLASSGPLQGRYLYEKVVNLQLAYLRKCSSILGYSYVTSKSASLLINDKLDLQVMIAPSGGYDSFKKTATTDCKGVVYIF